MSETERLHPKAARVGRSTPPRQLVDWLLAEEATAVRVVRAAAPQIAQVAARVAQALARGGRWITVGAGTSGRLAVLDAAECGPTFGATAREVVGVIAGGPKALAQAVEGAEDDRRAARAALKALKLRRDDVVCAVTASGRTPFALEALEAARAAKATTVLIACNAKNASKVTADLQVVVATGAELVQGSTRLKAGTATKLVLNAISTTAFTMLGRVDQGRMVALEATNQKLEARAVEIVRAQAKVSAPKARRALQLAKGNVRGALANLAKQT